MIKLIKKHFAVSAFLGRNFNFELPKAYAPELMLIFWNNICGYLEVTQHVFSIALFMLINVEEGRTSDRC